MKIIPCKTNAKKWYFTSDPTLLGSEIIKHLCYRDALTVHQQSIKHSLVTGLRDPAKKLTKPPTAGKTAKETENRLPILIITTQAMNLDFRISHSSTAAPGLWHTEVKQTNPRNVEQDTTLWWMRRTQLRWLWGMSTMRTVRRRNGSPPHHKFKLYSFLDSLPPVQKAILLLFSTLSDTRRHVARPQGLFKGLSGDVRQLHHLFPGKTNSAGYRNCLCANPRHSRVRR